MREIARQSEKDHWKYGDKFTRETVCRKSCNFTACKSRGSITSCIDLLQKYWLSGLAVPQTSETLLVVRSRDMHVMKTLSECFNMCVCCLYTWYDARMFTWDGTLVWIHFCRFNDCERTQERQASKQAIANTIIWGRNMNGEISWMTESY